MDIDGIAEAFRQVTPGNADPIAVQHGFDEQPIIARCHADRSFPAGQQVLDPFPLVIAKGVAAQESAFRS